MLLQQYVAAYREQMSSVVTPDLIEFVKTVQSPDPKRWATGYAFLNQAKDEFVKAAARNDGFATRSCMDSHRTWFIEYAKRHHQNVYGKIDDKEKLMKAVTPYGRFDQDFMFSNLSMTFQFEKIPHDVTIVARYSPEVSGVVNPSGCLFSPSEFYMLAKHNLDPYTMQKLMEIKMANADILVFLGRDVRGDILINKLEHANRDFMFDWMMPIKTEK